MAPGKSPHFSEPQRPHLQHGTSHSEGVGRTSHNGCRGSRSRPSRMRLPPPRPPDIGLRAGTEDTHCGPGLGGFGGTVTVQRDPGQLWSGAREPWGANASLSPCSPPCAPLSPLPPHRTWPAFRPQPQASSPGKASRSLCQPSERLLPQWTPLRLASWGASSPLVSGGPQAPLSVLNPP